MQLRYQDENGQSVEIALTDRTVVMGRGEGVEIVLASEKVSRRHAEIRCWDGDYIIKDLHSRNGTFVNDEPVDVVKLEPGDRVRIGGIELFFEDQAPKAPNTVIRKIGEEMAEGKGYSTMLRAIVKEASGDR